MYALNSGLDVFRPFLWHVDLYILFFVCNFYSGFMLFLFSEFSSLSKIFTFLVKLKTDGDMIY